MITCIFKVPPFSVNRIHTLETYVFCGSVQSKDLVAKRCINVYFLYSFRFFVDRHV